MPGTACCTSSKTIEGWLRATVRASAMINAKVDLYTVGAVLGHQSATSTKRYAHLATDAMKMVLGEIGKESPDKRKARVA